MIHVITSGFTSHAEPWMAWNLSLALLPWLLAMILFHPEQRHGPRWWAGFVMCVLLLPNAAYLLTDVVHLPEHIRAEPSDDVAILVVLPMFGVLFLVGFLAYADTVRRITAWARDARGWSRGWPIELTLHAVCVLGIYAGRVHRFNSWDLFVEPRAVVGATLGGLSRVVALEGMVLTFAVLAVGCLLTRSAAMGLRSLRR